MRRQDREVTDVEKVIKIIESCDCCRIGFQEKDGSVYIVPLNFGFERIGKDFVFYFHGAKKGKKISLTGEQQTVGFELDTRHGLVTGELPCQFSYLYQSIIGKGILRPVETDDEKINGLHAIMRQYSKREVWEYDKRMLNAVTVLKLSVTEWTCKEH